eukprot:scaffold27037_cov134-Skeletonema_menzelii.AAC.3
MDRFPLYHYHGGSGAAQGIQAQGINLFYGPTYVGIVPEIKASSCSLPLDTLDLGFGMSTEKGWVSEGVGAMPSLQQFGMGSTLLRKSSSQNAEQMQIESSKKQCQNILTLDITSLL